MLKLFGFIILWTQSPPLKGLSILIIICSVGLPLARAGRASRKDFSLRDMASAVARAYKGVWGSAPSGVQGHAPPEAEDRLSIIGASLQ